jgi:gamma-glutamylaminecyclotransferase
VEEEPAGKTHLVFVYGTLKKGFHWHQKYLWRASLQAAQAHTVDAHSLVVGESGVPYLLGNVSQGGKRITGEVWEVDDETLQGLDEYEGVSKGHYERRKVEVSSARDGTFKAECYFKRESSEALRGGELHGEYTRAMHQALYRPIRHIMVKQQLYLGDVITSGLVE